jgi:hypothetical protein
MTVNTNADAVNPDNVLSLREAIMLTDGTLALNALTAQEKMQVNGVPGGNQPDTILFNLPGPNLQIALATALPTISHPVTIDGFSQQGAAPDTAPLGQPSNAVFKIAITSIPNTQTGGLQIVGNGSGTVIRGLSIIGVAGAGIEIDTGGVTVEQNSLGIDPTGKVVPNVRLLAGLPDGAVFVSNGSNNLILDDLISGNDYPGILISGANAQNNRVQSNFIGTDAKGQNSVPNTDNGVWITGGAGNNLIGGSSIFSQGNLISGNQGNGVLIDGASTGNNIQGNLIGTNWNGGTAIGNGVAGGDRTYGLRNGVYIDNSASNLIGGGTADLGNLISGNDQNGVTVHR